MTATAATTNTNENAVSIPGGTLSWFELPVKDLAKSKAFYETVFEAPLTEENAGPKSMLVFPVMPNSPSGHLYQSDDGVTAGPTIHLACVSTVENAMERVSKAGGEVVSPVISIPAGRFAYCKDLDGNSIGLFEFAAPGA